MCKAILQYLIYRIKNLPVVTYKPAYQSNKCVLMQMARGLWTLDVRDVPLNIQPQMYPPLRSG